MGEDDDREQGLYLNENWFIEDLAQNLGQVPLVVLTMSPGSILVPFASNSAAILSGFLLGEKTGTAFADVLYGTVNPSGRLPVTFPESIDDAFPICVTQDCPMSDGLAAAWRDLQGKPVAFPFGHGLSFTSFHHSWLVEPTFSDDSGVASFSIEVTNTGDMAGREVVQVYLRFPKYAGEPDLVLRQFARTEVLSPGSKGTVEFTLESEDLSIWYGCDSNPYCETQACNGDDCQSCGDRLAFLMSEDGGLLSPEEATESLHVAFPEECIRCTAADLPLPGNSTTTATTTVAETTTTVAGSAATVIGKGGKEGEVGKGSKGRAPRPTRAPTPSPSTTLEPTP